MITLIKGNGTKHIDNNSSLVPILLEQGWVAEVIPETKKKEVKNGISGTTNNK